MIIDNYNIKRETIKGAEHGYFNTVRGEDRIFALYGLHHKLREQLKRVPTLAEYMTAYLEEWRKFLRERGVKSGQRGRTKDFDLNDYFKLKPFIEERAFKAYRSINIEDQVEQHIKALYPSARIYSHKLIDMIMGVDIVTQIENKKGEEVYLYIHVLDANTEEMAKAKKKNKRIKFKDDAEKWHVYDRDFDSVSHCYFLYNGKETTGMITVEKTNVQGFIEKELKRSESGGFDNPIEKGSMIQMIAFKNAVDKSERGEKTA